MTQMQETAESSKSVLPISFHQLREIMPHAPQGFLAPLNIAMAKYRINTRERAAAFLAQLAVESGELRHTHEGWSKRKHFKLPGVRRAAFTAKTEQEYFEHWYGIRPELGNTSPGDGYTYRGRGAIQITGKSAYIHIGNKIGQPLKTNPDLLDTDITVDMTAAACFFDQVKHLNHVADQVKPDDPHSVGRVNHILTKRVNGGTNGLHERLVYFERGLKVLVT